MKQSPISSAAAVADAFTSIRRRIDAAGGTGVALVAVTKGFGSEAITAAARNNADAIGENYVQELTQKLNDLGQRPDLVVPRVFFIGQLQTNKVKYLAGLVDRYESVDRPSLIREIARRDPGAEVLIQVVAEPVAAGVSRASTAGRGGCGLTDVDDLVTSADAAGLAVAGLMTVGPAGASPSETAAGFAAVRAAVDRLGLTVCSMGMSGDLEIAIREGSTEVRVGSGLFGERRYPPR